MDNLKKKLTSGAEIDITLAPFLIGHRLFKAVASELKSLDLNEDSVQKMSMLLVSSETIEEALWPCLARGTYNGVKITPELFENMNVRSDFLEVIKEVLAYNLAPFSKGIGSLSKAIFLEATNTQTPKST